MARRRILMTMPASAQATFDAFHDHQARLAWDTLLDGAGIEGGQRFPEIGAISRNPGRGLARFIVLRTRYVNYLPGKLAAAVIVEPAGPFQWWAASLHHRDTRPNESELAYTFDLRLRPRWFGRVMDRFAAGLFERATRRRFRALAEYLRNAGT